MGMTMVPVMFIMIVIIIISVIPQVSVLPVCVSALWYYGKIIQEEKHRESGMVGAHLQSQLHRRQK
jgi:type IV secretory pathway VirB3-like protein